MNQFAGAYQPGEIGHEAGLANDSPLQEILAAETGAMPYQESPYQESPYQESPYQESLYQESPYQESPYQESPYQESPYQELPYQELPYQESPYQESPYQESYESPSGWAGGNEAPMYEAGQWESIMSEDEEFALAAELLDVQSEEELDRFLGKLFKRVARGVRGFVRSPVGRMIGGVLRRTARVALPMVARAAGTFFGGPLGGMVGGQLANVAGQAMGLELQEMSPQDAEFAAARQFIRFAGDTVRRAESTSPTAAAPAAIVQNAVRGAAARFAPGLLNRQAPRLRVPPPTTGRSRGVWVRRGRTITLFGV